MPYGKPKRIDLGMVILHVSDGKEVTGTDNAKTSHVTEFLLQKMVLFPTNVMSCDLSSAN